MKYILFLIPIFLLKISCAGKHEGVEKIITYEQNKTGGLDSIENLNVYSKSGFLILQSSTKFVKNNQKVMDEFETLCLYNDSGKIKLKYSIKNKLLEGQFIDYYSNGGIKELKYYSKNKMFGDDIYYYETGKIKKYQFLIDSLTKTFYRAYSRETILTESGGSPLVYYTINNSNQDDSCYVHYIIADKIFDSLRVELSFDKINYTIMYPDLSDTLFPNNLVFRYSQLQTKKTIRGNVYLKIFAKDKFTKEKILYSDSLDLISKSF